MSASRWLLVVTLLVIGLTSVAQPNQRVVDSTAALVRTYYNARQPDSIYALTDASFKRAISLGQFATFITDSFATLGLWQSTGEPRLAADGYYHYPAQFAKGTLDFLMALDEKQKISGFALQPARPTARLSRSRHEILSNNALRNTLDRQVDSVVSVYMRKPEAVGLSVGILRNDSLFVYGYGETRVGSKSIPTGNTLFEIGSVSKTFTAALLAEVVRRGLVKLDDPASNYLPDSLPSLRHEGADVTLRMLANHTAGLPRLPANLDDGASYDPENPYAHYDERALFACLKKARFIHKPGTVYDYSNLGMGLLGTILSRRTGKSYEQLLMEVITSPLGLTNTVVTLSANNRLVQGYDDDGQAAHPWNFQALTGAGGIRSTVNDLLRYLQANLGNAPAGLLQDLQLTQQPTHTERTSRVTVGLGWHVNSETGWWWHNGGTGGFWSFLGFEPTKKTGIVVLANSQVDSPDEVASQLSKAIGL